MIKLFALPDEQTRLLWCHSCNKWSLIIQLDSWGLGLELFVWGLICEQKVSDEPQVTKYLFMKPYPFRTLNHFTVPWTKVAAKTETAQLHPSNTSHAHKKYISQPFSFIMLVIRLDESTVCQSLMLRLWNQVTRQDCKTPHFHVFPPRWSLQKENDTNDRM